MRQKAANAETYMKAFHKQQEMIQKTEAYIRKFKAGSRSNSAKSREKQLARVDRLTPPGNRAHAKIAFPFVEQNSQVLVDVDSLVVGYDKPLLSPMNFTIAEDEVLVLEGFNGVGKSTLLRTILGLQPAISGSVEVAQNVVFGYFEQELNWKVPKQTPLQYMMGKYPAANQRTLRQVLSRTALTREEADKPLMLLSGGEQSKVKIADLMMQPTNLLIMDEPTNHLDDDTKNALRQALIDFPGAVVLVSHEEGFYDDSWVDTVVNVAALRV
jgi:ATPase subunit of ABC transporter with duplicated ATPase domains